MFTNEYSECSSESFVNVSRNCLYSSESLSSESFSYFESSHLIHAFNFAFFQTLYGGEVNDMSARSSHINCATSFSFVESQHINLWFHSSKISHFFTTFAVFQIFDSTSLTSVSGSSSGNISQNKSSIVISMSQMLKFFIVDKSYCRFSISRGDSFNLLSRILNFFTCSSVSVSAFTQGTVFNHNFFAHSSLQCQIITMLFLSITSGCMNQNSLIEFARRLTCVSSCFLLLYS